MLNSVVSRRRFRQLLILPIVLLCGHALAGTRLEGHLTQGGVLFGHTEPGSTLRLDGQPVKVSPDGRFVIGFGRDAKPRHRLAIRYPDGRGEQRELRVERRKYRIQRIDGLPPRKVTPRSKKDLAHIRRDIEKVKKARARVDERLDFTHGFNWPVIGPITGVYGSQRILNGKPKRPHYGVDVARPVGTPVHAPAPGIVTLAEPDMFYSGGTVIVDHGYGLSSSFLHMRKVLVKVGQRVEQGDVIGELGATGRATGPHLDWRMNWLKQRVDPALLAGPMPKEH